MEIAGGAMLGYWAIGSVASASPPASMITMAITQAKIGLSMKKLTTFVAAYEPDCAGVLDCPAGAPAAPPGAVAVPVCAPGAGWVLSASSSGLTCAPGL